MPTATIRRAERPADRQTVGPLERARAFFQRVGPLHLSRTQSCVLIALVLRAHKKDGTAFPGNAELQRYVGHDSTRHVSEALTYLQRLGILKALGGRAGGRKRAVTWRVVFDFDVELAQQIARDIKSEEKARRRSPREEGETPTRSVMVSRRYPDRSRQGLRGRNPDGIRTETLTGSARNPDGIRQTKGKRRDRETKGHGVDARFARGASSKLSDDERRSQLDDAAFDHYGA